MDNENTPDVNDLIEALTILSKYMTPDERRCPTHCEHDVLIVSVQADVVSQFDHERLEKLGFFPGNKMEHDCCFISYRFGSA